MNEYYFLVKNLHILTAIISGLSFVARGVLVQVGSELVSRKWVRIAPHINDTILLACAIWLAVFLQQSPGVHPWLTAKVIALLLYIVLGVFALKRGKTVQQKRVFFFLACVCFSYIVAVALTKSAGLGVI